MKRANPDEMPGFKKHPHRRWFYVQTLPGAAVGELLDGVASSLVRLDPKANGALIEEPAIIVLPRGENLQAISFKTTHTQMATAIVNFATDHGLVCGEVEGAILRLADGRQVALDSCRYQIY
jgi:hypothetical protein